MRFESKETGGVSCCIGGKHPLTDGGGMAHPEVQALIQWAEASGADVRKVSQLQSSRKLVAASKVAADASSMLLPHSMLVRSFMPIASYLCFDKEEDRPSYALSLVCSTATKGDQMTTILEICIERL